MMGTLATERVAVCLSGLPAGVVSEILALLNCSYALPLCLSEGPYRGGAHMPPDLVPVSPEGLGVMGAGSGEDAALSASAWLMLAAGLPSLRCIQTLFACPSFTPHRPPRRSTPCLRHTASTRCSLGTRAAATGTCTSTCSKFWARQLHGSHNSP